MKCVLFVLKDAHLREIDRQEDPMLEYMRKKKEKRVQASGSAFPRKFTIVFIAALKLSPGFK